MNAARPKQPEDHAAGEDPARLLSALEDALRQALAALPQDRVVKCVASALPLQLIVEQRAPLHQSKVRKVSVSMPEELSLAIRERTEPGGFSRYIAEAAEKRLRGELFNEYLDELDRAYGPVPPELTEQARREWPDSGE